MNDVLLVVVVVVALGFDFTNGFHDTANAIATSVGTRAVTPRVAVLIAAVANLAGAFVTTAVAKNVAKGLIDANLATQQTLIAALAGAIAWNLLTWWFGLPSSSSHALDGSQERIRDIKELEHEGDRLTHEVVDLLNRTFVTPFDRDDMYRLAGALDDICDHVDEAAGNIVGYGVTEIHPAARAQGDVILRAATKLQEAVERLEGFRDSRRQLIELRELEDEGDDLNRGAISELFRTEHDAMSVLRWKDIHEALEEAVDACENAADVLEAIVVKNR